MPLQAAEIEGTNQEKPDVDVQCFLSLRVPGSAAAAVVVAAATSAATISKAPAATTTPLAGAKAETLYVNHLRNYTFLLKAF